MVNLLEKWETVSDYYPYLAEKIIIENNGRTAATGCKGYVANNDDANEKKVRICWTIEVKGQMQQSTQKITNLSISVLLKRMKTVKMRMVRFIFLLK